MRITRRKFYVRREDYRDQLRIAKSFEDAIQSGIARASKTVHNIKGAWVKEQQVVIENSKIMMYRVDLKVTFILD